MAAVEQPPTHTRREPVRLSYKDGQVIVTPEDQDIFFISAEKATEACKNAIRAEERVSRFKTGIILPLLEWCETNKDRVSACYVGVPESAALPVYVVGATERYDFDLTEKTSELAFQYEDSGWAIHVSQIPNCDRETLYGFFNPDRALQVF